MNREGQTQRFWGGVAEKLREALASHCVVGVHTKDCQISDLLELMHEHEQICKELFPRVDEVRTEGADVLFTDSDSGDAGSGRNTRAV